MLDQSGVPTVGARPAARALGRARAAPQRSARRARDCPSRTDNNKMLRTVGFFCAVGIMVCVLADVARASSVVTTLPAADAKVNWAGRTQVNSGASVSFDWLGVTARFQVADATYVSVLATSTADHRGTRLKAYTSDQGFMLSPQIQFWVPPMLAPESSNRTLLWTGSPSTRIITLENIVDPQYGTGVTTVHSFETDGSFITLKPTEMMGGGPNGGSRRIEFIGDSITAATNVVRPE
eukprot:COSAG02_NODE_2320_length_9141_cov_5.148087_1_plen_236_part_10